LVGNLSFSRLFPLPTFLVGRERDDLLQAVRSGCGKARLLLFSLFSFFPDDSRETGMLRSIFDFAYFLVETLSLVL